MSRDEDFRYGRSIDTILLCNIFLSKRRVAPRDLDDSSLVIVGQLDFRPSDPRVSSSSKNNTGRSLLDHTILTCDNISSIGRRMGRVRESRRWNDTTTVGRRRLVSLLLTKNGRLRRLDWIRLRDEVGSTVRLLRLSLRLGSATWLLLSGIGSESWEL